MTSNRQQILAFYDREWHPLVAEYYGHSNYMNYGYWTAETKNQAEACENLVATLLSMIPDKKGNILDVACGRGASTRHLLRYYRPSEIVAINVSKKQLEKASELAPGCTFLVVDAARLEFPDCSFDNAICVEAAFHFDTRDGFYREVFRVLKPGGRLVTSDILGPRLWQRTVPANALVTPGEVADRLAAAGFRDVRVVDATEECWRSFCRHLRAWPRQERKAGRMDLATYVRASVFAYFVSSLYNLGVRYYVLTSAQKP
jgi:ubiquinone/menaquinone biosynthesis C-methylase UbiE